jgi:hypothetical protein
MRKHDLNTEERSLYFQIIDLNSSFAMCDNGFANQISFYLDKASMIVLISESSLKVVASLSFSLLFQAYRYIVFPYLQNFQ